MDYSDFKQYGIEPTNIEIDTYRYKIMGNDYAWGVEVSIELLGIAVKCNSLKSQVQNKNKCLEMLKVILEGMKKGEL